MLNSFNTNIYIELVRLELRKNVSINIQSQTIDQILSEILKNTGLTYVLNDRQVMIMRKGETEQQQKSISINGTIRDAQQVPLPGVNVIIKGTTKGTTTDINGNYFIEVPHKNTVLVFSYIGFESQEINIAREADTGSGTAPST